jgi:hypothetical protein
VDPICTCHSIDFISIDEQPQAFIVGLDSEGRAKLLAACESAAMGFVLGRPHGSRTVVIGSAKSPGLFALHVVWPGSPEPQLRLICVRDGSRVLVARGFIQIGPRIPASEVDSAERAIARVRGIGHERQAEKARP